MPASVRIRCGRTNNRFARVDDQQGLVTSMALSPPDIPQKNIVFRQFFTDDGTSTGSNDMGVDGSSTTQQFYIKSSDDDDRYITTLSWLLTCGAQPELYEFADIAGVLTNGCQLYYEHARKGIIYIHDAIKSNLDLVRLGLCEPAYGGAIADIYVARHLGATNDYGVMPVLDLRRLMPPYGIKIERGTTQKLVFSIRDNCTAADVFNCVAYGFDRTYDD